MPLQSRDENVKKAEFFILMHYLLMAQFLVKKQVMSFEQQSLDLSVLSGSNGEAALVGQWVGAGGDSSRSLGPGCSLGASWSSSQ